MKNVSALGPLKIELDPKAIGQWVVEEPLSNTVKS